MSVIGKTANLLSVILDSLIIIEVLVTASAGFGVFQNFASGVAGASGYLLPAADS